MSFINRKATQLKPSATLKINQKIIKLREEGRIIYHFGFGQSPFPVPSPIVEELKNNAASNKYLPTAGLPQLKNQIAKFLRKHQNIGATESSIFIGPGSKELLYQTILLIDGTYLIPKGSWVSYVPQITLNDKEFAVLDTYFEDCYKLRPDILETYLKTSTSETHVLILNSPNNPTGAVYTEAELEALARVCRSNNVLVLSDEIYSQLTFRSSAAPSISTHYPENTIVYGGLSKVFAAGGYRCGFMHVPPNLEALYEPFRSLFSETFSAVSAPIQYASVTAFAYGDQVCIQVEDSKKILETIGHFVEQSLVDAGLQCTHPEGGFYMLVDFEPFRKKLETLDLDDSVSLANYILEDWNVALLPGTDFYFSSEAYIFRLAYVDFDGKKALMAYQKNEKMVLDINFIKTFAPNVFMGVHKLKEFVNSLP